MEPKQQELKSIFKVGSKYTLFKISECMAMCSKTEINVKEILYFENGTTNVIFTKPRGRKRFILPLEKRAYQSAPLLPFKGAIFEGWNYPLHCDSETGNIMRGNACYNFVGIPLEIQLLIDTGQLNPFFDKSSVLAIPEPNNDSNVDGVVVYPELVEPGRHAVIDRLLAKAS